MALGTILDRRTDQDRRVAAVSTYSGPEKRKSRDRRDIKITICVFCGDICGEKKSWFKTPGPKKTTDYHQLFICDRCASKLDQPNYIEHRKYH